ncbi:hypothetical protein, partial [Dendronalium sp. ChiSLP03b]|uniref:hypothetical protein n=1 Tax=Dendronalium sp. ChiSLP03b TaxID=3075381 RepID=UPI00391C3F34
YPLRLRDSSFCLCSVFSNTLSLRPFPISLPHFVPTLLHYFSLAMPLPNYQTKMKAGKFFRLVCTW